MSTTLIILAHPERKSFNGAWAEKTDRYSQEQGHKVIWSDLCSMEFDPVESAKQYSQPHEKFDPLKAQEDAASSDMLPDDVAKEIEKILDADRLIFHFPIWWFNPPAILKGWCDRVLAHGAMHNVDKRFDNGICKGKKVLMCATTGAQETEASYNGKEGDATMLLWPLAYTLRYLGMSVLEPKIINGIHGYFKGDAEMQLEDRLEKVLLDHTETISNFDNLPEILFNSDSDFDDQGRLKSDAPSYTHFIRHKP